MTNLQILDKLMKEKNYEGINLYNLEELDSYRLTNKQILSDIEELKNCPNKSSNEIELKGLRTKYYTIICKKKTQKGKKALLEISQLIGSRKENKGEADTLTSIQLETIKEILISFK